MSIRAGDRWRHRPPFQVADNGTGLSTLYNGNGGKQAPVVTIRAALGSPVGTVGTPAGTVFNSGASGRAFMGDQFLFATENGTISGWQPMLGTAAAVRIDSRAPGEVYKGLAISGNNLLRDGFRQQRGGRIRQRLYATDHCRGFHRSQPPKRIFAVRH